MKFFRRKKMPSLSELQGVPAGTFHCDVCRQTQPLICLCGSVIDVVGKLQKGYTLCGICAMWLGADELLHRHGWFVKFSEEQREKIRALHKELDIADKDLEETASLSIALANTDREKGLEKVHEFLECVPNLREIIRLRFSLLPPNIIDLSGRLTRGEFVDPSEIEKVNK